MNILVSTTRDWNVGDNIIWLGVKKLIDEVLPGSNYFFYNRNPDLFDHWSDTSERVLMGNYLTHVPDFIDLVVMAGTPEFYDVKMKPFYSTVGERPIWAIGIAWGVEHLKPNEHELSFMKRDNFKAIVRSDVSRQIMPKEPIVLPCPALLSGDVSVKTKESCFIGDIAYNKHEQSDIYCYHIHEFEKAIGFSPKYFTEPGELLSIVSQYETVYTSRLHAGFAAISTGSKVVFEKIDFRIQTALDTLNAYSGNLKNDYLKILHEWKQEL